MLIFAIMVVSIHATDPKCGDPVLSDCQTFSDSDCKTFYVKDGDEDNHKDNVNIKLINATRDLVKPYLPDKCAKVKDGVYARASCPPMTFKLEFFSND